ncbi:MAG: phosphoesterase [Candidatus Handelsmanbacteria bacterium RIFCSPLOWO2_12_FULL_64_10]|uniref:Phosphoesterase n=1 Tax=Handelsmanbacteria sp. (strain RIFCSPLOWO2_12_FULL_64_10) TaxID=1817868 RepID=A0A1F6CTS1_HANXR|nr:MAG: phosphoesterase [Candidatus Handelsmanbacteria bacterium RIFCSPLOWO2_12_FULL_64_10]
MNQSDPIKKALELPGGARFYRCALQVNSFRYLKQFKKTVSFSDEMRYNAAVVQACLENGIEILAVTDHYRVQTAVGLWKSAQEAGIYIFPGFEAVTKDGVHLLCLFDVDRDVNSLERVIGQCGIHEDTADSPIGQLDVEEFLTAAQTWGAVCIAAHVASDSGLLAKLSGQSGIKVWKMPHLLACSLPGPVSDAPAKIREILENRNPDYRRHRPIAILNAQDVDSPEGLAKSGASCWIKMSEVSVEGLRQAFLDPDSRIRLSSDPHPEEHAEFVAMAWQGGFLDGEGIHFNENLNVLIGGRGTGKSTVVESLRYALDLEPLGEEARTAHEGIVQHVLKSGTKISLFVRSYRPTKREYLIERTVPNPPIVREETGRVLNLTPADVMPRIEVYGQHEISELTKSKEKLTRLLERFVERDPALLQRKVDLQRELERSRGRVLDVRNELKQVEERLAHLPALEEMLQRFQEAGLEERLKEKSLLVREERILKTTPERIAPFQELLDQMRRELPIDRTFLSSKALEGLPGKDILAEMDVAMERLSKEVESIADRMAQVLGQAEQDLDTVAKRWEERRKAVQDEYERILRELQRSKVDGAEFIRLRQQIEELRPLRERQAALQRDLKEHEDHRRNLLAEWEDVKAEEFRELERAAKKVSKKLDGRVWVQVAFAGNRDPLFNLLREQIGGRLAETVDVLKQRDNISLKEFADACRAGRDHLVQKFDIPSTQADRIAQASPDVFMQVEELYLSPTTTVKLNVAPERQASIWKDLDELSTGQKATAVLLLLLLESDAPLVVDQPEDDLDNRFITEGIVPKMREEKRRRQFVFATHNANIPVLGDAELIVGLRASGEAGQEGHAEIPAEHMGSIDGRPVRELVEELLEGGKDAFEMRRLKYGF